MTVNQAKLVNANAITTGGFKFSGKGVKFSAKREAVLA
jgi:hypothetical protein